MELKPNDLVVVPGLGVGTVKKPQELELRNTTVRAFPVDMGESAGIFWIPEDRIDGQGLRRPMDEKTASLLIERIAEVEAPKKRRNWRQRQKRYQEAIASNDPEALADIVGELAAVRSKKRKKKQTLSFSERRLFERAKALLFGEIEAATGKARAVLEKTSLAAHAA